MKPFDPFAVPRDAGAPSAQPCGCGPANAETEPGCGGRSPLPPDGLRLDEPRPDVPQLDACCPPVPSLVPKAADDAPC